MKYTDEDIIAYLNDELDEERSGDISAWIKESEQAQQRVAEFQLLDQAISDSLVFEPSEELLSSFREKISEERGNNRKDFRWFQVAAAVALMVTGFVVGRGTMDTNQSNGQLADLQGEVRVLQQMVMMNSLKEHSASERLQVINRIEATPTIVDDELIHTLIQTMGGDDNTNVRFAAVQALGRYMDQEIVRSSMVRSLAEQGDPLVQIAMINLLMEAGEETAIAPIKQIADNEGSPNEVRLMAEIALGELI